MPPAVYGPQGSAPIIPVQSLPIHAPSLSVSSESGDKALFSILLPCSPHQSLVEPSKHTLYHGLNYRLPISWTGWRVLPHPPPAPPYTAAYPESLALCSIAIHMDTAHMSTISAANVTTRYVRWPISTNCCN